VTDALIEMTPEFALAIRSLRPENASGKTIRKPGGHFLPFWFSSLSERPAQVLRLQSLSGGVLSSKDEPSVANPPKMPKDVEFDAILRSGFVTGITEPRKLPLLTHYLE